ncbi:alpha/beta hydrolase [Pelagibacterales bacterium]|jgi:alpha/beta superfamily hydrolase|nr:alpha/beta hydrolase [Pelagibacterales bacterium]MDB9986452.1 alpha/beta hydrolase [Pelagibacterales bacterium]|tara:strand:+ start:270 stop:932 length:663 start_codon:yes stop_codon:yes gene_type:complete
MSNQVKEILFTGPDGRLVGKYKKGQSLNPPVALLLHPHPLYGGTMNNPIVMELYNIFDALGFSTFRFNFRGVGKSEGKFDNGLGELADAAAALDWVQRQNPNTNQCWVSGFSFGAVICMQLLMRRPEITRFVSVSPQPNLYDFNFLAPCPASGLIVHGKKDEIAPLDDVQKLAQKLQAQKNITVEYEEISGANHFYDNEIPKLKKVIENYIEIELNSRFR